MPNPIHFLESINKSAKVLLYPSSCAYSPDLQNLPFDAVILNSHVFEKPSREGKVYCLSYDNNELLGILAAREVRISAMVVIRDGCVEGGNYECVTGEGFFGRLMSVAAEEIEYSFDHGRACGLDVPASFEEIASPGYLASLVENSDPIGPIRTFRVTMRDPVKEEFAIGRLRVKVVRDTIWRTARDSQLCVIRAVGSARYAVEHYVAGLCSESEVATKFEFVRQPRQRTVLQYLELADAEQYERVSIMPTGKTEYRQIVDELREWEGNYPKEVLFYHLNVGDFQELKRLASESS